MSSPIGQASKALIKQPAFIVAFVVLLVAAVSLNAATQFMKLHFKKEAVALRKPLDDISMKLPPAPGLTRWECVTKDQLSEEMEQELGTRQYVMRLYVRHKALTEADWAHFEGLPNKDRTDYLNKLRANGTLDNDVLSFAVTYYTGKADTVAHIPERCYTADGSEPTAAEAQDWPLKTKNGDTVPVRYVSFEDPNSQNGQMKRNVAYFFHTNGAFTSESSVVRLKLQNLLAKYGYYAKVEMMVQSKDRNAAKAAMQDFLGNAMPEIDRCLPDWAEVEKMAKGNRG